MWDWTLYEPNMSFLNNGHSGKSGKSQNVCNQNIQQLFLLGSQEALFVNYFYV